MFSVGDLITGRENSSREYYLTNENAVMEVLEVIGMAYDYNFDQEELMLSVKIIRLLDLDSLLPSQLIYSVAAKLFEHFVPNLAQTTLEQILGNYSVEVVR